MPSGAKVESVQYSRIIGILDIAPFMLAYLSAFASMHSKHLPILPQYVENIKAECAGIEHGLARRGKKWRFRRTALAVDDAARSA
jgi:hypothetical protein